MQNKALIRKEFYFRIAELANVSTDSAEKQKLLDLCDNFISSVERFDSTLHSNLLSDIQKDLNSEINRLKETKKARDIETAKAYNEILQKWMQQSKSSNVSEAQPPFPMDSVDTSVPSGLSNPSGFLPGMVKLPSAVPLNILPFILRGKEINVADFEILKAKVFTEDIMNVTLIDYSNYLITVRAKPLLSSTDKSVMSMTKLYQEVLERIQSIDGINSRIRVFMLPEYRITASLKEFENVYSEKYSGHQFEPIFVVTSSTALPRQPSGVEYGVNVVSILATIFTCFLFSIDVNTLNTEFLNTITNLAKQPSLLGTQGLIDEVMFRDISSRISKVATSVLGLQIVHEIGHAVAAKIHGIKSAFPISIPSLQVGAFGAVTRLLEYPKNRKQLFDFSISGPTLGFISSLVMIAFGLSFSNEMDTITYPALPMSFFQSSFFFSSFLHQFVDLSKIPVPYSASTVVLLHPMVLAGLVGVLINAYNCFPIGRLDGGRVLMSIGGRRALDAITSIFIIGQGILFITSDVLPSNFFWTLFVLFFQRGGDLPPEDDVTAIDELDRGSFTWVLRVAALTLCLAITGSVLFPAFDSVQTIDAIQGSNSLIQLTGIST